MIQFYKMLRFFTFRETVGIINTKRFSKTFLIASDLVCLVRKIGRDQANGFLFIFRRI